jgi:hypothetical protein
LKIRAARKCLLALELGASAGHTHREAKAVSLLREKERCGYVAWRQVE